MFRSIVRSTTDHLENSIVRSFNPQFGLDFTSIDLVPFAPTCGRNPPLQRDRRVNLKFPSGIVNKNPGIKIPSKVVFFLRRKLSSSLKESAACAVRLRPRQFSVKYYRIDTSDLLLRSRQIISRRRSRWARRFTADFQPIRVGGSTIKRADLRNLPL